MIPLVWICHTENRAVYCFIWKSDVQMHKAITSQFVTHYCREFLVFFCEICKLNWLVPFAIKHFSFVWLAFLISDYYGTADFLYSSLRCNAPNTSSQTFLNLYSFNKALRLLPYTVKPKHTLNHSCCVFLLTFHSTGNIPKNQRYILFQSSPFQAFYSNDAA